MSDNKEKLDYLEHEDVGTMEKETNILRSEESKKEIERIASLKIEEKASLAATAPAVSKKEIAEKKQIIFKTKKIEKILIRFVYFTILLSVAGVIYSFITKSNLLESIKKLNQSFKNWF